MEKTIGEAIGEILLGIALVVGSFYLSNKLNCNKMPILWTLTLGETANEE